MPLSLPLVLDFDGTLHHSDLFWEGFFPLLKHQPLLALYVLVLAFTKGKVAAKLRLAQACEALPALVLPWDERVLAAAQAAEVQGRAVHIATGSPQAWVEALVKAKGLTWPVHGTTPQNGNLVGRTKAAKLVELFGEKGFDYAGNSMADVPVWASARGAWVANAPAVVRAKASHVLNEFPPQTPPLKAWFKALRPHQWLKNMLVIVPLLAAHMWFSLPHWGLALVAFVAFSLAASGAYLLNDVLDIAADRAHPRKRHRPFAAGTLPLHHGAIASLALILAGLGLALAVQPLLSVALLLYIKLTFSYSFWLKYIAIADTATLATLWGVRLWGGALAISVPLSPWLLLFAFLMFYSLALLKRFIELRDLPNRNQTTVRGYRLTDAPMVAMQGIASGMLAALVVALYINSPTVSILYSNPEWLLPITPIVIWWVGRIWLLAQRDGVHEDPIVFAATDRPTLIAAALILLLAMLGSGAVFG